MKILFPFVGDNIGGSHISSLNLRELSVLDELGKFARVWKEKVNENTN